MLDIKLIRDNPEEVKQSCRNRQMSCDVERVLELDKEKRHLLAEIEGLRAEQNRISKLAVSDQGQDRDGDIPVPLQRARELKEVIKRKQEQFKQVEKELNNLLLQLPNLLFDDVPVGKNEAGNVVVKEVGKIPKFSFKPKDHLEIGERLGLIDVERASKISGSRFGYLKGEAALLEFALVKFALDILVERGFTPLVPPVMIKPEIASGMGYVEQTNDEEAYYLPKDNLYLVGTAEQSIGSMHANEVLNQADLPLRYVGFSACFRREAGSYGKDTQGILRVHQFDKVEMFSFCHPDKSREEHKFLIGLEEKLMKEIKLPYRLAHLCTGDMSKVSASTFDIETWLPGQGKYRETHSCSNCTDFQARRLNIRYRDKSGKLEFVHMLNGTAFAIGRMLIAILENNQKKDGSVELPKALQKYIGFKNIPAK